MSAHSIENRWHDLRPHIEVFGPKDDVPRPAVILLHGSGGVREHLRDYARVAERRGVRAFVIDSYSHRGWGRLFSLIFISTLTMFRGYERTGDLLAVLWGLKQRSDVDPNQIILAGWSHGSWTIMDLMSLKLDGDAPVTGADPMLMDGVQGLFLVYPYIGKKSRTPAHTWRWWPQTLVVISVQDHITAHGHTRTVFEGLNAQGLSVETLTVEATHAYDEPGFAIDWPPGQPMRHHPEATQQTLTAFGDFIRRVLNLSF